MSNAAGACLGALGIGHSSLAIPSTLWFRNSSLRGLTSPAQPIKTAKNRNNRTFMSQPEPNQTSRREFLKTSSTAVISGAVAAPFILSSSARGASPGETLRLGLIGCGGRGNGAAANAMTADSNTVLHAMADIQASRIEGGLSAIRDSMKDDARIEVPK